MDAHGLNLTKSWEVDCLFVTTRTACMGKIGLLLGQLIADPFWRTIFPIYLCLIPRPSICYPHPSVTLICTIAEKLPSPKTSPPHPSLHWLEYQTCIPVPVTMQTRRDGKCYFIYWREHKLRALTKCIVTYTLLPGFWLSGKLCYKLLYLAQL